LGYLGGERHVRLTLAMDMVQRAACMAQPRTTLAWMATPTDCFAVPQATAQRAMTAFAARPAALRPLQAGLRLATAGRLLAPNLRACSTSADGQDAGIVDSLVLQQGPNYAMAKRLQQWRALVARHDGHRVSLNVAPSTLTASVVHNPALAAGFAGAGAFGVEVFRPETTSAMMAALWVHDLRTHGTAADPATPLRHPLELLTDNACHGGLWTLPYQPRSALPLAAAWGWLRQRWR
jgi:hypothetical protein